MKETYDFAAAHDYMYSNLSLRGIDPAHKQLQQYWKTVERYGHDDNPYRPRMAIWRLVRSEGLRFKKTLFAIEQERWAVARRRAQWKKYQGAA